MCIWEDIDDRRNGSLKARNPTEYKQKGILSAPIVVLWREKQNQQNTFQETRRFATELPWSTFKLIFYATGGVLSPPPPSKDLLRALPQETSWKWSLKVQEFFLAIIYQSFSYSSGYKLADVEQNKFNSDFPP